jgi:hypothetical protein
MSLFKTIRSSENFHIVLWLMKDLCWVMDFQLLGVVMITPTLGMAAWIAWRCRGDVSEFLHSLAVVFWITANSIWMIGEFFFDDHSRHFAAIFFVAGLLCVAWYYLVILPRQQARAADTATGPDTDPTVR